MSVVVFGPYFRGYTKSLARAFEVLGHPATAVEWSDLAEPLEPHGALAKLRFQTRTRLFRGAVQAGNVARLRRRLLEAVERTRPRLVLGIKPWWLDKETLLAMRTACPGCKIGIWMMDSVAAVPALAEWAAQLDHLFLFEPSEVGPLREALDSRVSFLPDAFDDRHYAGCSAGEEGQDLFFCGAMAFDSRRRWAGQVARIARRRGWSLELAGSWWTLSRPDRYLRLRMMAGPLWSFIRNAEFGHAELGDRYRSSRISLNVHHEQSVEGLNTRTFEVAGAGGVLLTDLKKMLGELFRVGVDLMTYSSPEELEDKAGFLLRHESARSRMRISARETALRRHTFVHRANTIIQRLNSG